MGVAWSIDYQLNREASNGEMGKWTLNTKPTISQRNLTLLLYSEPLCGWAMDPVKFDAFNNVQLISWIIILIESLKEILY
jgi:hypothetical protein